MQDLTSLQINIGLLKQRQVITILTGSDQIFIATVVS